jgi:hypothetical protein
MFTGNEGSGRLKLAQDEILGGGSNTSSPVGTAEIPPDVRPGCSPDLRQRPVTSLKTTTSCLPIERIAGWTNRTNKRQAHRCWFGQL